ncbi:MAG: tRNA lysidine(34) synthetase TilS [Cellulosilyticaceae bacterium]
MIKHIEQKIRKYIKQENLILSGEHLVVGVSGGMDSMMLIDYLYRNREVYNITMTVAHIHHGVRKQSDEELEFVRGWCKERLICCEIHRCNIVEQAKIQKKSEEEVGREERYRFFISLTNDNDKIVTAHHQNDQVETMIMHFLRGADLKGLGGMKSKRGQIIRPLLSITRQDVQNYCNYYNVKYYDDETNQMTIYTRNKMRLECLPYLKKEFNPALEETLIRQSILYQEAESFFEQYEHDIFENIVECGFDFCQVQVEKLKKQHPYIQKRIIMQMIVKLIGHKYNIGIVHIQSCIELLDKQSGKKISLPHKIEVTKSYDILYMKKVEEIKTIEQEQYLQLGENKINESGDIIKLTVFKDKTFEQCMENYYTKYVDYDKIKGELFLRTRCSGDIITLENGKKKLKKLFIDQKIPQEKRNSIRLIVDTYGEIVWAVGVRLSSKYYVDEQTKRVLEIRSISKDM